MADGHTDGYTIHGPAVRGPCPAAVPRLPSLAAPVQVRALGLAAVQFCPSGETVEMYEGPTTNDYRPADGVRPGTDGRRIDSGVPLCPLDGVLGLPTESEPYLLPLSCGYDGDSSLYFTYLLGESSWKAELTDAAESARFLAYSVETQFNWRSVLLTGDASAVPEEKWSDVEPLTQNAWRPNTRQAASTTGGVAVYEFRVRERDGI